MATGIVVAKQNTGSQGGFWDNIHVTSSCGNAVTRLHPGQSPPLFNCEVDPSVFEPPPDYTTLGPGRSEPMRDEDDNLLQFAIQQSLLDAGTESDQVRARPVTSLRQRIHISLHLSLLLSGIDPGHSYMSEQNDTLYWSLTVPAIRCPYRIPLHPKAVETLMSAFLGDHLGGPDQQPPGAPVSTIRGRLSAGEVSWPSHSTCLASFSWLVHSAQTGGRTRGELYC